MKPQLITSLPGIQQAVRTEIFKHSQSEDYYGSEDAINRQNNVFESLEAFGFKLEDYPEYESYILKANVLETYNYLLEFVIPFVESIQS